MRAFSLFFILVSVYSYALEKEFPQTRLFSLNDFSSTTIANLSESKSLVVVFSKDCVYCKEYFQTIDQCLDSSAKVIPVSIDEDKRQISRYWKKVKSPLKAWQVDKDFQAKFKELGQGMPYTYLFFKNVVYPVGAGIISCDRLAKLNTVGTKG